MLILLLQLCRKHINPKRKKEKELTDFLVGCEPRAEGGCLVEGAQRKDGALLFDVGQKISL
jgi:hypothetical protein